MSLALDCILTTFSWTLDVPNCAPPSPLKRQFDDPTAASSTASSSEASLGRRGRLANLAATIGSWEDDLSHPGPRKDNAQGKAGTACVPKLASRDASVSTDSKPSAAGPVLTNQTASSKSTSSSNQVGLLPNCLLFFISMNGQ